MNWPHVFDVKSNISDLYQIAALPTLVLIDREGKIIYRSTGQHNDADELLRKMNNLN